MEFFLVLLITAVVCSCYSNCLADSKGHNGGSWTIGGLLFGPLALVAAAGLPDLKQRKYLRLIAEQGGAVIKEDDDDDSNSSIAAQGVDADEQRRRILGGK
jgi:hypothetical protein